VPPAGIDPLVVVINNLLALLAFAWHNLVRRRAWPRRWW